MDSKQSAATPSTKPEAPYEAPKVETVLTKDDLEREGQHAGGQSIT